MATPRIADQVGRVLGGRYRLVAPIGSGASAHVYAAEDARLGRRVAVKLLHPALAGDQAFLRRFQAEARAAAALGHPDLMAVYDWGEDDDGPFLVTELLAGGSLRDLLDRGVRLTPPQAARVGLHAARGLDHAHRRNLVHRDIKPGNLLFDEEGRLRIADFGVARALAEAAWTEPLGAVIGSARYASPEQARGADLDGRSDVYSLALVLVEAVTGHVPFSADTTIATLMARQDQQLPVPGELGPLVPVLERAGRPDPADRLDAAALAAELEAVARELPEPDPLPVGEAGPVPRRERAGGPFDQDEPVHDDLTLIGAAAPRPDPDPTVLVDHDAPGVVDRTGRPRRRWPLVAALALLVALAVAGGAWLIARAATPSHPVPSVVGLDRVRAVRSLRALDFRVAEVHARKDGTTPGQVIDQQPAKGTSLKEGRLVRITVSDGNTLVRVPDLKGRPRGEALHALRDLGLTPVETGQRSTTVAKGTVIANSHAGQQLERGQKVDVTVSEGPPPVALPDVHGQPFDAAKATLERAGFVVVKAEDFADDVQTGQVIRTSPGPSPAVEVGTKVTVVVSRGPKTVVVPNVKGRPAAEAAAILQQNGLNVTGVFGPGAPGGRVVATDPPAGAKVPRGTDVVLFTR